MMSLTDYVYINFVNYDKKKIVTRQQLFEKYIGKNFIILDKISSINDRLTNLLTYSDHNKNIVRIIPLNYFQYMSDMRETFKTKEIILDQLLKDINRIKLTINGNLVKDIKRVDDYLSSKFLQKKINNILMLCNQSIMAIPCRMIQTSIKQYNNYYLSEIPTMEDYEKDLQINIDITENNVNILGFKNLRIVQIIDGEIKTLYILKIIIEIELNNEIIFIKMYGNKSINIL
jgi:hypothetical protein